MMLTLEDYVAKLEQSVVARLSLANESTTA
jgi:hypothetical protein